MSDARQIALVCEARTVLSLCDYTGTWSAPYEERGYRVVRVDLRAGQDVRLMPWPGDVHGVLAAPPCTHLAASGARWWSGKGEAALTEALAVVDACLRVVAMCRPSWWALENPVGRLSTYLGPPPVHVRSVRVRRVGRRPRRRGIHEADLPVGQLPCAAPQAGRASSREQDASPAAERRPVGAPFCDPARLCAGIL